MKNTFTSFLLLALIISIECLADGEVPKADPCTSPPPISPFSLKSIYCPGDSVTLSANCGANTVRWYDQATGGNLLGTTTNSNPFIIHGLSNPGTYYPACVVGGCESSRPAIKVRFGTNTRKYVKQDATGTNDGSSWENAYTDLQPALDASCEGTEIWVARGTYHPTESPDDSTAKPRNRSFHFSIRLSLYGGFAGNETLLTERDPEANLTVLSGDFNNDDIVTGEGSTLNISNNSENAIQVMVVFPYLTSGSFLIDGFTIKGGNANGTRKGIFYDGLTWVPQEWGGGLVDMDIIQHPQGTYSLTLNNMIFTGNSGIKGGGVFSYATTRITHSKFIKNKAFSGGGLSNGLRTELSDVIFEGNHALYKGGGVSADTSQRLSVDRVYFRNNYAQHLGGGLAIEGLNSSVNNAVFVNNSSKYGGAIFTSLTSGIPFNITNSTISKNTATIGGGLAYSNVSENNLKNTIIWGNTATNSINNLGFVVHPSPYMSGSSAGTHTQTNTLIEGFGNADSNIDTNPLFINENDIDGADNILFTIDDGFNLNSCSPAINAGTNTGIPGTDILEHIRPFNNGTSDIGAFEHIGLAAPTNVTTSENAICVATNISLTASCSVGTVTWYNQATGGSAIGTGSPLIQNVSASTTFYASCKDACTESSRTASNQVTFGWSIGGIATPFENYSSVAQNNIFFYKTTISKGITVDSMAVIVSSAFSGGSRIKFGVYSDNSGAPNTLLASSLGNSNTSLPTLPIGTSKFPLVTNVYLNAGTYWIGFVLSSREQILYNESGANAGYYKAHTFSNALPSGTTGLLANATWEFNVYFSGNVVCEIPGVPTSVNATPNSVCEGNPVTLSATCGTGIVTWYAQGIGGSAIGTGSPFTIFPINNTPAPTRTFDYYAACKNGVNESNRVHAGQVILTSAPPPLVVGASKPIYCQGESITLEATCTGTVHWYNQATGGTIIGATSTITIPNGLQSNTTYYAACVTANCESSRSPVLIKIGTNARKYVKYDAVGANNGTSWQNAYTTLQPALDASCDGTEIWVAKGTYYPTKLIFPDTTATNRDKAFFYTVNLSIYGGFTGNETLLSERNIETNPTILSGDFNNDDIISGEGSTLSISNNTENALHVIVLAPVYSPVGVIDGFTIKGGNADIITRHFYGGGIFYYFDLLPSGQYGVTLNNITFIGNSAIGKGGAVGNGGKMQIKNSKFIKNKAFLGGGLYSGNEVALSEVSFEGNRASYKGGGLSIDSSKVTLNKTYFKNNHAQHLGGGMAYEGGEDGTVNNTVFIGNSAGYGGGIFASVSSNFSITNSTIAKNTATNGGGVVYSNQTNVNLKNTIIWGNTATVSINNAGHIPHPLVNFSIGTPTLNQTNSLIEGFGSANGNIDANPLFRNENDPDGTDNTLFTVDDGFNLTQCSPAINVGTNTGIQATDILNNPRPFNGGTADIGAFEYAGLPVPTSVSTSQTSICGPTTISLTASCAVGVVNWYNQATGGSAIGTGSPLSQTVSGSTTFYASCKDACGESSRTATQQITYGASGPPAVFESNPSVCINKSILLSATCPGGTVSWYNANTTTLLFTGQMYNTPNLSTNTTYKVRCESLACASNFVDVNVTIAANPTIQISGSANLNCETASVTRTASGGSGAPPAGYLWSNGLGNSATATMTAAGTYTVTVTNANGCTATATTVITQDSSLPSTPTITAPNPKVVCAPSTLVLTASGCGGTIAWSNGSSGTSLTLSAVGTYSISATCTVGSCTSVASSIVTGLEIVNQPSAPTITAPNPKVVCAPSTLVLTASGCGGTIAWSNGSSGTSLTLSTVGTYSISATCAVGSCTSVASSAVTGLEIVNQPSAPTITAPNPKVVCAPSTLVLTASGCGGTIAWSNGSSGTSLTLSAVGTYSISATCTVGSCTSVASSIVTGLEIVNQPLAPTINAPNPKVVCAPSTLVLTASGCGGTVTWSNGSSGTSLTLSAVGTYSISATCTVGSCTSVASSTVTGLQIVAQPSAPTITAPNPKVVCAPSTLVLTASGCAGTIAWSNGSSGTSLVLSAVGTYSISATCTVGSCTSVASSTVTGLQIVPQPSAPTITAPNPKVVCAPSTLVLTASGCGGTIAWSNGSSGTSLTLSAVGTYSISATCTVGSCMSVASSTVTGLQIESQPSVPTITAPNPKVVCAPSTLVLTASGCGGTIAWSNGSSGTSLTLSAVGTYSISATCTVGSCTSVASSTVTGLQIVAQPSAPTINAPNPKVVCAPSTLVLTASGCVGTVMWSNGSSGTSLTLSTVGTYSISATCAVGSCTSVASSTVTGLQVVAPPVAQASNTGPYSTGQTIELSTSGGTSYSWVGPDSFIANIANPTITNASAANGGIYTVTVSNNGCSSTATTQVIINGSDPCTQIVDLIYVKGGNPYQAMFSLKDGMVIQYTTEPVSIMAVPICLNVPIGSVDLTITGPNLNWTILQNVEPFTIFDNLGANIYGRELPPGTYTFTVTGYPEDNRIGGTVYGPIVTTFTIVGNSATINAPTVANNNLCAGSMVNVTFAITGSFNPGNSFSIQLSDSTGSFVNPTMIGSSNSAGTVVCQLPQNLSIGGHYLIRVVSSNQVIASSPTANFLSVTPANKNLVTDISAGNTIEQAAIQINASNKIISPANVTYNAGKAIVLNPGFEAREGSIFRAQIQACNN